MADDKGQPDFAAEDTPSASDLEAAKEKEGEQPQPAGEDAARQAPDIKEGESYGTDVAGTTGDDGSNVADDGGSLDSV